MKQEILFVDDEEAIRELLAEFFSRKGYDTRTAATEDEARQAVAAQKPTLVVLDIGLGDSDGLTLLQSIRGGNPELPIMMLTGMGFDHQLLEEALKKGANGYMSKTLSLDHLLLEVRRVLKIASRRNPGQDLQEAGGAPAE